MNAPPDVIRITHSSPAVPSHHAHLQEEEGREEGTQEAPGAAQEAGASPGHSEGIPLLQYSFRLCL